MNTTRSIVLILPNIRSCHNVGAMFRTADACGIAKLYLVGYTPTPPKPQIDKVSLGAETWVPWEAREDIRAVMQELKKEGYIILGLERADTSTAIEQASWRQHDRVALIVGNEVDGIDQDTLSFCDDVVHIPMLGKKESLNVSIAAGIAMYVLRHG